MTENTKQKQYNLRGISTTTSEIKNRYARRIRKQFQPFTITVSKSSNIIQHVRTKSIKKNILSKSTVSATTTSETNKKNQKQEVEIKKVAKKRKIVAVLENTMKNNNLLKPRLDIANLISNPYLYSTKALKFISISSYSRINAHRCVVQKNIDKLRRIAYDKNHFNISALEWPFCPASKLTAEGQAILAEDQKLLKIIHNLKNDHKASHAELEPVILNEQSCGHMSILGHATAKIQMTRGGREGINALLSKSLVECKSIHDQLHIFIRNNVSFELLAFLVKTFSINFSNLVYKAIRYGHRHLAAYMIEAYSMYNFNDLHITTLRNDTQPLKNFLPISLSKKGRQNRDITPFHTAAINPNVNYLKILLAYGQQSTTDLDGWDLIHYAAVCEGTEPLKHLLSIGISPITVNKKKQTPLHLAARAGRVENVKILIDAIQKYDESMHLRQSAVENEQSENHTETNNEEAHFEEEPETYIPAKRRKKPGDNGKATYINARSSAGKTPLHMAASRGYSKIVNVLLNVPKIIVDTQTSAKNKKLTPLMIACARGFLDVANALIDTGGAVVEKGDQLKRTSLTHAVINGQVHIVAMLLRRGASPLSADTSGHTPAHYAAAFGWFDCLTLLAKADPNCLSAYNDWHLTPLSVAYMKGHYGIMEWLVDGPYSNIVDINCRDQSGATLLSSIIKSYSCFTNKKILSQLQFLIGKGANCSLKDTALNSPFHYFCAVNYKLYVDPERADVDEEDNKKRLTKDEYRRCFDLFLANGAKLLDKNDQSSKFIAYYFFPEYDALHLAAKSGNLFLVELIFEELLLIDPKLEFLGSGSANENKGNSFLHLLILLPFQVYDNRRIWAYKHGPCSGQYNIISLLQKLVSLNHEKVRNWLWQRDENGRTPLLHLCEKYASIQNTQCNEAEARTLGQFLSILCVILRELISLDPKILLQSVCTNLSVDLSKESVGEVNNGNYNNNDTFVNVDDKDDSDEDTDHVYNNDDGEGEEKQYDHIPGIKDAREKNGPTVFSYALEPSRYFTTSVTTIVIDSETYDITNNLLITLIEAAKEHHILLELLNQRDNNGFTPLLRMVSSNNLPISMYLLRAARSVMSVESGKKVDAAFVNYKYCAKRKKYIPWKKTVLMFAVENCMIQLIEELNLSIAEWNAVTDNDGCNAFHFAAQITSSKSITLYELLKQKGVEQTANKNGQYPLHIAVASLNKTDVDILTEPLDWFTKNEIGMFMKDKNGCLPIHYCFNSLKRNIFAKITIDPVAILSVLLPVMRKDMINEPDSEGYTALHYAALNGANICVVTLLQNGANPNAVNNCGNSPLALAVLHKNEACTLTLIQSKSDMIKQVYITKKATKERKKNNGWIWIPYRLPIEDSIPPVTIPSLIVRNEWQGIVYVLLNILGKSIDTVGNLVCAALEYRKYNLAQTLLGIFRNLLQDQTVEKQTAILEQLDLFFIFVKNMENDTISDNIMKVSNSLLLLGCKWYRKDKDGMYVSQVVECLASQGKFHFMDVLHELDQKSAHPIWSLLNYELKNNNPLVGVIETWIKCGPRNDIKFWLKHFAAKFGINTLMQYEQPAFDGMHPCLPKKPVTEYRYMTPLIRAIQCSNIELIEYLLQEKELKTDVNQPDEYGITPLMHACMVNSKTIIHLLFDPEALQQRMNVSRTVANVESISIKSNDDETAGLFDGFFGKYENTVVEAVDDDAQTSSKTDSRKKTKKLMKPKFDLKSSLDPFKQCIITNHLACDERKTKNFLHFMLEPCGWENIDLLEILCRSVPHIKNIITESLPDTTDIDNSPIFTAYKCRQERMLGAMKKLTGMYTNLKVEYPVTDVSTIGTKFDIDADCERYLAQDAEGRRERMKEEFTKTFMKPHEFSGYIESGEICMKQLADGELVPYKILLTKTDINRGHYGFHNYYRMELIKRKGSELYVLFTNWGRIGDRSGQYQQTPFGNLEEADKEFSAIFRSKTGNDFADIKNFSEKLTKYRLVKWDSDTSGTIADLEIDFNKSTAIDKKAAENPWYKLIKDISNVKRLQKQTRMICRFGRSRIPFGCISRSDLLEAQKLLRRLQHLKIELDNCNSASKGPDETLKILQAQAQVTNEFYRLMPLGGFENSKLQLIDNDHTFEIYEKAIENLLEMEVAGKLITAAAYNMNRVDPYMYIADSLECGLELMNPDDLITQRILQYIQISSSVSVEGIYSVKSKEAAEAFNKSALKVGNHRYLWHGTKAENLLSILKVGLLASPPFALQTGQSFGQGIYFTDVFCKSEPYCKVSGNGFKYIMLCEVALGRICYGDNSSLVRSVQQKQSTNYDSLKVIGQQEPDPLYDMTLKNGCVLPLGRLKSINVEEIKKRYNVFYPYTDYNEYVVRDKTLTLVRYLIVFR